MNVHFLLVTLAATTVTVHCAGTNPDADRVDWNALFKGLHLDFCNAKCAELLKPALAQSLKEVSVYQNLEGICVAYDETLNCAKKSFCIKNQVFSTVMSGVEDLCKGDKHEYIRQNEKCIKPRIDEISQKCDAKCHLVKELADYSQDNTVQKAITVLQMMDKLDGVCRGLHCYLSCLRKDLDNKECPTAGGVITSGILRPFYVASEFIAKLGPNVNQIAAQKMPPSCAPLIDLTVLNNITGPTN